MKLIKKILKNNKIVFEEVKTEQTPIFRKGGKLIRK